MSPRLISLILATAVAGMGMLWLVRSGKVEADPHRGTGLDISLWENRADKTPSFAVVELFTSEGCASCPPADRILSQIAHQARERGLPIYTLAFHIDYWDRLGWTDPFARAAHSSRQLGYARAVRSPNLYTPQMIINGQRQFVGSDHEQAARTIDSALEQPAATTLSLRRNRAVNRSPVSSAWPRPESASFHYTVHYTVNNITEGLVLNFAVVERDLRSEVKRGENAGRSLRHDNVVRVFETVELDGRSEGAWVLELPLDLVRPNASVIGFLQHPSSMSIVAATGFDLP